MSPAIPVNRMRWPCSCLPRQPHAAVCPEERGWGRRGCRPQMAQVPSRGIISVNLDSGIFPYIEKC